MAKLKYFQRIRDLLIADQACADQPLPPFDFASLGRAGPLASWFSRLLFRRLLPAATFLLRQGRPNLRLGRVVLVTRAEDVGHVLNTPGSFKVVYGLEMTDLAGGFNTVLGEDGEQHASLRANLAGALRPQDFADVFNAVVADAEALLQAGGGRIDVMSDLISRTAAEAAGRYFGLTIHDPDLFGQWTMALSTQLFGDFNGDANVHRQARTASAHLASLIDDAIVRVQLNNRQHPNSQRNRATLIDRMITDLEVSPGQVRATIIGLVTAFVPTNTLAAGNMLEVLLDRPDLLARVCAAANQDDRQAMRAALLEAGRLNPALSPGLWRHLGQGDPPATIGKGRHAVIARPGDLVLACIPSALRDGRGISGGVWPLSRLWMMFGFGPHVCWGAELALAHLEGVFIALFKRGDLRRAPDKDGVMVRTGPFPTRMDMLYAAPWAKRALAIVALPVRPGVDRQLVEQALSALGNPARADVAASLSKGDLVQFASLSVIERAPGSTDSILLFELSGDGDEKALLTHVATEGFSWLAPIVSWTQPAERPITSPDGLALCLQAGFFELRQRPWGPTGLHFDGLGELSVADIARQERVAAYARQVVDRHLKQNLNLNTRAMAVLLRTRRLMRGDPFLGLLEVNRRAHEEAQQAGLAAALMRPRRKRLAMVDWEKPKSFWSGLRAVLAARDNRFLFQGVGGLVGFWFVARLAWGPAPPQAFGDWAMALIPTLVWAVAVSLITLAGVGGLLVLWLARSEARDPIDPRAPSLEHVQALAQREDASRMAQNHIIAVMPLKRGLIRRLSFAFALWGIRQSVTHFFRPGFVVTIGTIHKARWFRVPGTEQFVFFSNYDGSWQSYLEDFITRAHEGQSAAWSHGVGFPRTRFLIFGGAADGDNFKQWVRRQQRPTPFWYSRFSNLTAQQIRDNAMIEDGLARASTDTDARRWLANFGSSQRGVEELEMQEAQTLIFNGLGRLTQATSLMMRLPQDPERAGAWVSAVSGLKPAVDSSMIGPPKRWVVVEHGHRVVSLPRQARVLFGEQSACIGGAIIGLTAKGLERCGLNEAEGLATLPPAFRMTMAGRAGLLGDALDPSRPWRFSDQTGDAREAHVMLTLYGHEIDLTHDDLVEGHIELLRYFGGEVVHQIPLTPTAGPFGETASLDIEPFGFRDGISQPVIVGTRRAAKAVATRDRVAPGEFLLGYRNHQGYLPPTITVGAELDPACNLPTVSAATTNRYPGFGGRGGAAEARDFGRNGTFIAVRQLDQDVDGFWAQAARAADQLSADYPDLAELAGETVSPDWVAAKIVGRWRNGAPLIGHLDGPAIDGSPSTDENDFAYGVDDPRGLACPLGAHIRRVNPRDSLEPGDEDEQQITNRHRLLRRGRAYSYAADADGQRRDGLLFMAVCSDLERQFEFVQRTWINATAFHGLVNERDPLLNRTADASALFTIPTAAGPIRVRGLQSYVDLRGGAYLFLPSRSALAHLIARTQAGLDA